MSRKFLYVNKTQGAALTQLQDVLHPEVNDFACKGVVPADRIASGDLILHYYNGPKQVDQCVSDVDVTLRPADSPRHLAFPVRNALEEDPVFDDLLEAAVISGFGRGLKDVVELDYRKAKEIKVGETSAEQLPADCIQPPNFALSLDLMSVSGVLSTLSGSILKGACLYAKPNKLNIYSEGGFFKWHWECVFLTRASVVVKLTRGSTFSTAKAANHVGTITFCLPTRFTGGELVVSHGNKKLVCNWSEDVNSAGDGSVARAFLFADCSHEVLPMISGTRITIAYDIYISQESVEPSFRTLEDRKAQVMAAFQAVLGDDLLSPAADFLGFALSHHYPTSTLNCRSAPPKYMLKGVDALLVQAAEALGLSWKYIAVHNIVWDGYSDSGERSEGRYSWRQRGKSTESDDSGSESGDTGSDSGTSASWSDVWVPRTAADKMFRTRLCVTDDIESNEGNDYGFDEPTNPGPYSKDTLWVSEPRRYEFETNYTATGNGSVGRLPVRLLAHR